MELYRQMKLHPHAELPGADSGKTPAPFDFAQAYQPWPWARITVSALRSAFGPVCFESNLNRRAMDECLRALETRAGVAVVEHLAAEFFRLVEIPPFNRRTAREPCVAPFFRRMLHGTLFHESLKRMLAAETAFASIYRSKAMPWTRYEITI
jgi:hypothetical protein